MVSGEVAPVNNHTRFNAFPVGMWYNKGHNSPNKMTAFWSWDHTKHTLSESTIYFLGESDEFVSTLPMSPVSPTIKLFPSAV